MCVCGWVGGCARVSLSLCIVCLCVHTRVPRQNRRGDESLRAYTRAQRAHLAEGVRADSALLQRVPPKLLKVDGPHVHLTVPIPTRFNRISCAWSGNMQHAVYPAAQPHAEKVSVAVAMDWTDGCTRMLREQPWHGRYHQATNRAMVNIESAHERARAHTHTRARRD